MISKASTLVVFCSNTLSGKTRRKVQSNQPEKSYDPEDTTNDMFPYHDGSQLWKMFSTFAKKFFSFSISTSRVYYKVFSSLFLSLTSLEAKL